MKVLVPCMKLTRGAMNHARDQYAVHAQELDDSDLEVRPLKLSLSSGAAQNQLIYLVGSPTK